MPPSGGPHRNVGTEKREWFGDPMVKKFEDTISHFDRMYERDRQTDRQTLHDGIGRTCLAYHVAKIEDCQ